MCICRRRIGSSFRQPTGGSQGEGTLEVGSLPARQKCVVRVRQRRACSSWASLQLLEKQLAQEAVRQLEGVTGVVNQIEVIATPGNGNVAAKYQVGPLQCADPEERKRGLKEVAEAGHIPAMCDYARLCDDTDERKYWLREAAYEGHVPAIYRYGLECSNPVERKRWLRQAAEAGEIEAMYTYAQECEDPVEAEVWLRKTACEGHVQAMYDYAMRSDDLKERRRWLMRTANQGWEAAVEALDALA